MVIGFDSVEFFLRSGTAAGRHALAAGPPERCGRAGSAGCGGRSGPPAGASCATAEEARIALAQEADYIGTGPVYATPSKADAGEPVGTAAIAAVVGATPLPVVGIGGIGVGDAAAVVKAGACGVI